VGGTLDCGGPLEATGEGHLLELGGERILSVDRAMMLCHFVQTDCDFSQERVSLQNVVMHHLRRQKGGEREMREATGGEFGS
jgi:hypothetical protein